MPASVKPVSYTHLDVYKRQLTFCLARYLNLPIWVTAIVGLVTSGVVALIISLPALKLRRDYFALLSVGFGEMVLAIVILLGKWTNAAVGFSKIPKVNNLVWIILGITVLIVFMVRNLKYSRFGRMCIALKTDEIAARSFGINVYVLKVKIYVVASIIAAVGGICFGLRNRVIAPDSFDWSASAEMQILLFFGGTNSLTGSVISAASLKVLPEFLKGISLFGMNLTDFKTTIYCVMILLVINFRMKGLMGEQELSFKPIRKLARKMNRAAQKGGSK